MKKDNWIVCGDGRLYNTKTGQYKEGAGGEHLYVDKNGVPDYKR